MVALVELELPNVQESVSIGLYDRLKPAPLWHVEDLFGLLPPDGNSLLLDQGGSGTNDPRAKEEAIASVRYQRWSDLEQWCRTLVLDFLLLAAMLVVAYRCQQPRLTRSLLTLLLPLQHARTALYRSQLSCRGLCGGWLRGRQLGYAVGEGLAQSISAGDYLCFRPLRDQTCTTQMLRWLLVESCF